MAPDGSRPEVNVPVPVAVVVTVHVVEVVSGRRYNKEVKARAEGKQSKEGLKDVLRTCWPCTRLEPSIITLGFGSEDDCRKYAEIYELENTRKRHRQPISLHQRGRRRALSPVVGPQKEDSQLQPVKAVVVIKT